MLLEVELTQPRAFDMVELSYRVKNNGGSLEIPGCYHYSILSIGLKSWLRSISFYIYNFGNVPSSLDLRKDDIYVLFCYKTVEICNGFVSEKEIPLALSNSLEELHMLADLNNLSPLEMQKTSDAEDV